MKRTLYNEDTFEYRGRTFKIEIEHDADMGEPWKEHDGHGLVSDWTTRDKTPGERILVKDGESYRYYDNQETLKLARRDGWGIGEEETALLASRLGRTPTKREITAEAVEQDYRRMRGWCLDEWYWVYVRVTMLNEDGEETDARASLGGIESDSQEYISNEVANELADECLSEQRGVETAEALRTHSEVIQ